MEYVIVDKEYGKAGVKLLFASKVGKKHSIKELEVETSLTLASEKDYKYGDNSDIIATDSQKNTVYVLAKQFGVESLEKFGIILANHFITKYPWVLRARVALSQTPWKRIQDPEGVEHNHAFFNSPSSTRIAEVIMDRTRVPKVRSGIRGLTVIKTTQSAFVNFVSDEYRTLPDAEDRIFSTIVTADWSYANISGLDFCKAYSTVESTIIDVFAGPAYNGVYSPSVQNTQYEAQKSIMKKIPQISSVKISMPNRHYFPVDFTRFNIPEVQGEGAGQVLMPVDKPSGMITSNLARSALTSKL
ncbi:uricase isoform X2 [Eurytemora carolleeae]|uniref:uricase isoform X2 n=1 Tax=Eurytemora carolleeae TaxID=1294199 RepID=UPI000C782CA4|nr:uricase isoform X2 [Eurytemora carolleeae]|eukprot:XP_023349409.1 uricase-like isoform X2 [Eurytemora affinis]